MAVAYNPGAALVLHTPKACSHICLHADRMLHEHFLGRNQKIPPRLTDSLYVTGLSDREAIFGGEGILRECLLSVIREKQPDYVVVVSGCAAGVIGDDVEAVSREVETATGVPVLAVKGAGFLGKDRIDGFLHSTELLVGRFAPVSGKECASAGKAAVFFGGLGVLRSEGNVAELERLLAGFGVGKIMFPPVCMSTGEFALLPAASFVYSYALNPAYFAKAQQCAKSVARRYDLPFLDCPYPLGLAATSAWIEAVGSLLGQEKTAETIWRRERDGWERAVAEHRPILQGKTCLLCVGHPARLFGGEVIKSVIKSVGVGVSAVIMLDELSKAEREEQARLMGASLGVPCRGERELGRLASTVDFVVTTHAIDEPVNQLRLAMHARIGVAGMVNLLEKMSDVASAQSWGWCYE